MLHGLKPMPIGLSLVVMLVFCLAGNSVCPAQDPPIPGQPSIGFGVAMTGAGGLYNYAPGRRGILHVNVVNRQNVPLDLLATTYFDDEPTLQYGRQIWLPPRSRLQTWHPILISPKATKDTKTVRFQSLFMQAGQGREVLIKSEGGQLKHDGFLQLVHEPTTGIVESIDNLHAEQVEESRELIAACRMKQNYARKIASMTDPIFDAGDDSLAALDHLIIADSRPVNDQAGMQAIRRWLYSGGNLWIMLEQVEPELIDMLLGDAVQCKIVDRVTLTTISVEPDIGGAKATRSTAEFEVPVELARTEVSGMTVEYSVNGWPAAFTKTCGEGRLLITALAPRGWMKLRPPEERSRGTDGDNPTKYVPTEPMSQMASEFFIARKAPRIAPAVMEPIVQEYVGYIVPSRALIVGLLIGFCVLLAGTGAWLWRIGRLEWSGIVGPALAVAVSLILVSVGRSQRQSVPATAATMQFVRGIHGTDDFIADGQVGIYSSDTGQMTLKGTRGGSVMPDMSGLEGSTRRLIWTDLDRWEWQNLPSAAGLRNAKFQESGELQQRLSAKATFGPDGLSGQLLLPENLKASDAVLATVSGRIGVEIQPDGTFIAKSANLFSDEQFLSADLLGDEQTRRLKMFQQLLTFVPNEEGGPRRNRVDYPTTPTLLFWTEPWEMGFQFSEGTRSLGSALVTVPVDFQRPAAGTEVSIASPLLLFNPVNGPDGTVPSGLWDPRKREWAQKANPSSIWLRFQVPEALLPIETLSGRLVVRVTGPMGKLQIAGAKGAQAVPLKTWMDPVGSLEFEIPGGELLAADASGGILLKVSAGDPDRPELTKTESSAGDKVNYWQIESLSLALKAKTTSVEGYE